jgi:hypothetical protein
LNDKSKIQEQLGGLVTILVVVIFLSILFSALSILSVTTLINNYQATEENLEDARHDLEVVLEACAGCPLRGQLEALLEKLGSFAVPRTSSILPVITILLLGLMSIISNLGMFLIAKDKFKSQSEKHRYELVKAEERGRVEKLRSIAKGLVADKDVLSELTQWLHDYKEGSSAADIDASARIHSRMLARLVRQIRLRPINEIGDVVRFDPEFHTTYASLKMGEESVVKEFGWRVGDNTIKKPVVGEYK